MRRPKPRNTNITRTKWRDATTDAAFQRYYRIDSLGSAVDGMFSGHDPLFMPVIKSAMGPAAPVSITFTLERERLHELVFRMQVTNTKKKRATFALIAARHHGEFSRQVAEEFQQLSLLAKKIPRHVPGVFRQGLICLPQNRRSSEKERKIDAYLRQWIPADGAPAVARNGQIRISGNTPRLLGREDTETARCRIIEILAAAWNPRNNEGIDAKTIYPDDFVIGHTSSGNVRLRLVSCRQYGRLLPHQLMESIAGMVWRDGENLFPILPDDPAAFHRAILRGLGPENTSRVLGNWLEGKVSRGASAIAPEYAESLRKLLR